MITVMIDIINIIISRSSGTTRMQKYQGTQVGSSDGDARLLLFDKRGDPKLQPASHLLAPAFGIDQSETSTPWSSLLKRGRSLPLTGFGPKIAEPLLRKIIPQYTSPHTISVRYCSCNYSILRSFCSLLGILSRL